MDKFEKIIEEKIEYLKNEKREGLDDIVRLGQIAILQDVIIENFKRVAKC